jgi:aminopeptidase
MDARVAEYARLLVDRAVGVQPGWQVVVSAQVGARPLVEAVQRRIGEAGAWAITQLAFDTVGGTWARAAPEEILGEPAPALRAIQETADAFIGIVAPENVRDGADIPPARLLLAQQASSALRARMTSMAVPWVLCQYPTPALAQEAGLTLDEFADFLYAACLRDWEVEGARLHRLADRLRGVRELRIVGDGTDLRLVVEGRTWAVDDAHINLPGGEVFISPLEDATEGVVTFSECPGVYHGQEVTGARLRFEAGRVVDAAAATNEEFLFEVLDADAGARVLGELGIGCNPGITRYMRNTLFDEKIAGTVHLALGRSYAVTGGVNDSRIHWDMVKDLRRGGELHADGRLVQRDGAWLERI